MKLHQYMTLSVRSVSVSSALIPLCINLFFLPSRPLDVTMPSSLFVACSVILFSPAKNESDFVSLVFTILASFAAVAVCFGVRPPWICLYLFACICCYLAFRYRDRYRKLADFFKRGMLSDTIRFESRTAYAIAVIVAGCMVSVAEERPVRWGLAVMLLILYAVLFSREVTGHSFFFNSTKEEYVHKLEDDNYRRNHPAVRNTDDENARRNLFERIQQYMEDRRPYLDEHFETEDMSRHVGTNRTYLSQTLSMFSGWNFCQFVNKYRIDYAADLIKKDRNMKISEVSSFSGFHSQTTFNASFKFFMGVTPSAYKRHLWAKWKKSPSNPTGPERSDPPASS